MSINLSHLKKLIATMIPILIAQVSTVGMNFMDSTMSGHVSANDLAGVSIGASLFLPIQTTAMGLLTAATPMAAQLMGRKEKESIPMIIARDSTSHSCSLSFSPFSTTSSSIQSSKVSLLPPQFPPSPRTTCSHLWAHSFLKCSRCRCAH